jgi:acyl-CoA synthetase (AMP-forming)/AMP-acid ligase II
VLSETARQTELGAGVCVGRRFGGIEWRVVDIQEGPIPVLSAAKELRPGEIGELIVRGPVVTTEYVTRTEANSLAKIVDDCRAGTECTFWHRMGDVGYFDAQHRFWFCGRMSQRVQTAVSAPPKDSLFTIPCEAIFNQHPDVYRSALVGVGSINKTRPVIVIEPLADRRPQSRKQRKKLIDELQLLAKTADHTANIRQFLIRKSLPVDVRHNVKINREQLARWAARKLKVQQT